MSFTREERIEQIRDCGQSIIRKAETIYGDYECPCNLEIVIAMDMRELPKIIVNREFYPKEMFEKQEGVIPMP